MTSPWLVVFGAAVFAGVFVLALHYARKAFNSLSEQQRAERLAADYENQMSQGPAASDQQYYERDQGASILLAELADLRRSIRFRRLGKVGYLVVLAVVYSAVLYGTAEIERFRREAERQDRLLVTEVMRGSWRGAFEEPDVPAPVSVANTMGVWKLPITRAVAAFLVVLWATHAFLLFAPLPPFDQPLAHEDYNPKGVPRRIRALDERLSKELNELWNLVKSAPPGLHRAMRESLRRGPVRSVGQLMGALDLSGADVRPDAPIPPEFGRAESAGEVGDDPGPASPAEEQRVTDEPRGNSGEEFLS